MKQAQEIEKLYQFQKTLIFEIKQLIQSTNHRFADNICIVAEKAIYEYLQIEMEELEGYIKPGQKLQILKNEGLM